MVSPETGATMMPELGEKIGCGGSCGSSTPPGTRRRPTIDRAGWLLLERGLAAHGGVAIEAPDTDDAPAPSL